MVPTKILETQWIKRAQKRGEKRVENGGPKRVLNCKKASKTGAPRARVGNPSPGEMLGIGDLKTLINKQLKIPNKTGHELYLRWVLDHARF
jgi:hypothetical protein